MKTLTNEITDTLSFDANFRRQNVISDLECDRINLNVPLVQDGRQLAPELTHVDNHLRHSSRQTNKGFSNISFMTFKLLVKIIFKCKEVSSTKMNVKNG